MNELLQEAIESRASDIHFFPTGKGGKVQFRVDGALRDHSELGEEEYVAAITGLMAMAQMDMANPQLPQRGHLIETDESARHDMRVSYAPSVRGKTVVVRILDKASIRLSLEDISKDETVLDTFRRWGKQPCGLIFTTGPVGSGKTTMLYTLLNFIKAPHLKIMTVEDPVEYFLDGTVQFQVDRKHGVTAPNLIRTIMRQDPDVICVGETRDQETLGLMLDGALTGHLVMSQMRSPSACHGLRNLLDMGLPQVLLRDALIGISAQRLVRCLCVECREAYEPTEEELAGLPIPPNASGPLTTLYRPKGCEKCGASNGYRRRMAVYEQLEPTPAVWSAAQRGDTPEQLQSVAVEGGFRTMWDCGWEHLLKGDTSLQELARVVGPARCRTGALAGH